MRTQKPDADRRHPGQGVDSRSERCSPVPCALALLGAVQSGVEAQTKPGDSLADVEPTTPESENQPRHQLQPIQDCSMGFLSASATPGVQAQIARYRWAWFTMRAPWP